MKIDPEVIKSMDLDIQPTRIQVNALSSKDILDFMKESSERIIAKSDLYLASDNADVQCDCIDIVAFRLNDFVQSFIDVMVFIKKKQGDFNREEKSVSLRYCISSYESLFMEMTEKESKFLEKVLLRNEITHDYFNREYHQEELKSLMVSCSDGALDIVERLKEYCEKNGLLNEMIYR